MQRIGRIVGQEQNFARPGDGVDVHFAEHHALGRGDKDISRADDLVDFGNRLRAESQRGDGLGAADAKDSI